MGKVLLKYVYIYMKHNMVDIATQVLYLKKKDCHSTAVLQELLPESFT
jgi:hypothetical protein